MSFKEIYKKYCGSNVRAVSITNQSTALCKSLNFNFMPVWLSYIGETTILYADLIENVGKFVNDNYKLNSVLDSYFNSNFKEELEKEKTKSTTYLDAIIDESDVESIIESLNFKKILI